ncbi:NosD domain-containing protein [Methanosarcina sp. Mfa9]|uniref:NosD domain-containing protein n=1 Tax=Methanosarcina sp. Mfa9 TaxID=3439063 RepID=UPI003F82C5A6
MKNYARNKINIHIIFCLTAIAALLLISSGTAAADDIYVNSTVGSADFTTIQAAVDSALPNDTIIVAPDTYIENVDVNVENLTIRSESGPGLTTVQADKSEDHVFHVTADSVTISGFNITGAINTDMSGIYLAYVRECSVLNNTVSDNYYGIYLPGSSSNTLENNTANSNTNYGIWLSSSSSNTLENNTANSNGEYGIYLYFSDRITLSNNTANSNTNDGIYLYSSTSNTLSNNTANSNTNDGIYLYSSTSNTLSNNTANSNTNDGIYLYSSSEYNTLEDNTASYNTHGIRLDSSDSSELYNNTANSNTNDGIYLYFSNTNTLSNNTANSNSFTGYGITLYCSSNNELYNNTASDNAYGIWLYSSSSNTLSSNTANSNNEDGIILKSSNDNTLENNTASNNAKGIYLTSSSRNKLLDNSADLNTNYGIRLYSSSSNTLVNNTADSNTNYGIWLKDSENDTLESNTASDNGFYGIYLESSSGNRLFLNDLLDNSVQVTADANNVWNSSEPVNYLYNGKRWTSYLGNHYSDYEGLDNEGDGIGDTPYVFDITTPLVNDSYPLKASSDNYIPLAFDNEFPIINSVELSHGSPLYEGDSILVTVDATDNISVYSVKASGISLTCTGGNIWQGSLVAEEGTHPVNVSVADAWGNVVWDNSSSYTAIVDTDPSGVSGLQATAGLTWINWTWNNPPETDFNHTILYLDGIFLANTSDSYYNATGLHENTEYELGTLTVDFSGNINETWINDTATTDKTESLEPSSSGGSGTGKARIIPAGTGVADEPGEDPDGKKDESDGSDTLLPPSGDPDTPKTPTASDVTKATEEDGNDEGNDEEERAPGFELVFAVSGLLAALHFARKE